ncbi:nucleoside deaminase [Gemmata sp. JC717]|uniref:nucleoside deaminase n=1 Tax=Gemmata algarum TaxID=2975278 RepID=UPI0021BB0FA4|nr:nucleoside deaminase [Gemmata algarum]MDY3555769.1 nucleoside deaminase [Gemmata algarum]
MRAPDHERHMRRAIELTANAPELPFAAVIVHRGTGEVVAEGWNKTADHPLLHGEIDAINDLMASAPALDRSDLILYTTAEPCPMCQGAILWSGIGAVAFGTSIRFLLDIGWRQIDLPASEIARRAPEWTCEIVAGVLASACDELFLNASRAAPGR